MSLNEAINSISSYAISFVDDLKPDIIRRDAGRILKIVEYNNKSNVVVDEEGLEYLKKSGKYSKSKYINLFDANRSVEHSREKNEEWLNSNKNHFEQLLELNSVTTDDVQWEFEGEKIVPKSLNVARLMRASFEKTLSFTRIRRQIYEADFMRTFSLYTKRSILLPTEYQLLEQKIEQISASNNMSLRLFDEKHTSNIENLAETMHGHINSEHEHFKWVFETGYIYRSTTDAENIWKFYNHQCNFDRRKILSIFYVYFIKCDFNSKFVDPPIIYTTPCLIDSDHTRNFRVNTMKGLEVTNSYFSIELNSQGHPSSGDGLVLSKICWMAIGRVL